MPNKDLINAPATHDLCLYNSVMESEQAISLWPKEYTQLDKEIYLQKNIFFIPMPLFHSICTGNLRSFVFGKCDSQCWIMRVWEFLQRRVIDLKFQEKLIFYIKSQWKSYACPQ